VIFFPVIYRIAITALRTELSVYDITNERRFTILLANEVAILGSRYSSQVPKMKLNLEYGNYYTT